MNRHPRSFLPRDEVLEFAGRISPGTLYRWIRAGSFPAPRKLGSPGHGARVGWRLDELLEWAEDPENYRTKETNS